MTLVAATVAAAVGIAAPQMAAAEPQTAAVRAELDNGRGVAEPEPGPDALDKLYGALGDAVAADYTAHSWKAFEPVRQRATALLEGNPTPEEREAVRGQLQDVADGLVMTRGLRDLVEEYRARDRKDVEPKEWKAFTAALTHAESVLADDGATRAAVVDAKNALQRAASEFVPRGMGDVHEIRNDTFWHDTDGNPIFSQGGGIFRFGDTYYWYGVEYVGAGKYYNSPTRKYDSDATFVAIKAYSSQDLVNWTFERDIATRDTKLWIPASKDIEPHSFSRMTNLAETSWMGRMGVAYNESTGKYTALIQFKNGLVDQTTNTSQAVLFLQGDSPTDVFQYANLQPQIENSPTSGTGDQTVFTDDDGSDYLVFSNRAGRNRSFVAKIADSDSLSVEPAKQVGFNPAGREGNAMFKYDGHYYIATSALHGWNTSPTYLIRSETDDILGEYSEEFVLPGTEMDYSHVTQSGFFFTVYGKKQDTVVYAGDRWADFAWNGIGYNQWVPLSAAGGGGPKFNSLSHWRLNAVTGQWTVGDDNNYVLNPDFAADRVTVSAITGWTTVVDPESSSSSFVRNVSPGANSSRFALQLGSAESFSGAVTQKIDAPVGRYRLEVQASTVGDLDRARVRITGRAGEDYLLDLRNTGGGWQAREMDELLLTAGHVTVSVEAAGGAGGELLRVDQFSLTRIGSAD
ncbi:family 43 glycosylhydrolase [Isoptericola nanjingensis]|uniref:family 43 glycosylhydrolase n=1 Tax=Isoptericola nanjingensis TaxID=903413 RepID=UPI003D1A5437